MPSEPASSPARSAPNGTPFAVERTSVRRPGGWHRPAACRPATRARRPPPGTAPAVADATDSSSPPGRARGRGRTPPRWSSQWSLRRSSSRGRDTSCTKGRVGGSACRRAPGVGTPRAHGSVGSSRQPGAALGAAVLEHGAPGAGAHAGPEPVLLGPTVGIRLKSALHDVLLRRPGVCALPNCHDRCQDADAPRRCTGASRHTCDLARLRRNRHQRQPERCGPIRGPSCARNPHAISL